MILEFSLEGQQDVDVTKKICEKLGHDVEEEEDTRKDFWKINVKVLEEC